MHKKFALNILDEIAQACENKLRSFGSDEHHDVYDEVSELLTDVVLDLSEKDGIE